jgi:hypothetical protein
VKSRGGVSASAGQFSLGAIALPRSAEKAGQGTGCPEPIGSSGVPIVFKAKRVIYLHVRRSSHLISLQTELVKWNDKPCPDEYLKNRRFAFTSGVPKLMARRINSLNTANPESDVRCHSESPKAADELCVIKSMNTDQFNHTPAELLLFTGTPRSGRPSLGSWVTPGHRERKSPGFVVLISSGVQPALAQRLGSGFLPRFSKAFNAAQRRSVLYVPIRPEWIAQCAGARSMSFVI